jgi:hypothetical protein
LNLYFTAVLGPSQLLKALGLFCPRIEVRFEHAHVLYLCAVLGWEDEEKVEALILTQQAQLKYRDNSKDNSDLAQVLLSSLVHLVLQRLNLSASARRRNLETRHAKVIAHRITAWYFGFVLDFTTSGRAAGGPRQGQRTRHISFVERAETGRDGFGNASDGEGCLARNA